MKTAVLLIFSLAGLAAAEEPGDAQGQGAAPQQQSEAVPAKRLQSVTWDLEHQKLTWVVEDGVAKNGEFVPSSKESYEISPKDQKMAFQGEQRGFTDAEGAWLTHLLNVLTVYCAQSTVWWAGGDQTGGADREAPDAQPAPDEKPDTTPARIKVAFPVHGRVPGAIRLAARNYIY